MSVMNEWTGAIFPISRLPADYPISRFPDPYARNALPDRRTAIASRCCPWLDGPLGRAPTAQCVKPCRRAMVLLAVMLAGCFVRSSELAEHLHVAAEDNVDGVRETM